MLKRLLMDLDSMDPHAEKEPKKSSPSYPKSRKEKDYVMGLTGTITSPNCYFASSLNVTCHSSRLGKSWLQGGKLLFHHDDCMLCANHCAIPTTDSYSTSVYGNSSVDDIYWVANSSGCHDVYQSHFTLHDFTTGIDGLCNGCFFKLIIFV